MTDDIVRRRRVEKTPARSQFVFPYHFVGSPFRGHWPSRRDLPSPGRALENRCSPPPVDLPPPPPSSLINILLLFPRACVRPSFYRTPNSSPPPNSAGISLSAQHGSLIATDPRRLRFCSSLPSFLLYTEFSCFFFCRVFNFF